MVCFVHPALSMAVPIIVVGAKRIKDMYAQAVILRAETALHASAFATRMPVFYMMTTKRHVHVTLFMALSPVVAAVSVMHPEAIFHPAPIRRLAPAIPTKAGKKSGAARAVRLLARPAMIMPFQAAPAPATNRI